MTIGPAWDISDPAKPVALFDDDANIVVPIGLAAWADSIGTTYADHEVRTDLPLEVVSKGTFLGDEAGTVPVRMRRAPAEPYQRGRSYPFTLRLVGTDGTQDDRTFWLKLKPR